MYVGSVGVGIHVDMTAYRLLIEVVSDVIMTVLTVVQSRHEETVVGGL